MTTKWMSIGNTNHWGQTICLAAIGLGVFSCTDGRGSTEGEATASLSPSQTAAGYHSGEDTPAAAPTRGVPAAMCNGRAIQWESLRDRLVESSGADVLGELVLDMQVESQLRAAGLTVGQARLDAEEALVRSALSDNPQRAAELLEAVRTRQGLGKARWQALIQRNAGLRLLVADGIEITEALVEQAHESLHGARRRARIIVVPDLALAQTARARIIAGEPFGEVAASTSADPSAARGGLVDPISRVDPSWPRAVRDALFQMSSTPDEGGVPSVSGVILLDRAFVLLGCEGEFPADGASLADTRAQCERAARMAQERLAMEQLAQSLLREAKVTVFDQTLHEAWKRGSTPAFRSGVN